MSVFMAFVPLCVGELCAVFLILSNISILGDVRLNVRIPYLLNIV